VTLDAQPRSGDILVASPTLLDRNFSRTVVLLCAHDLEGSMGLVLNRPSRFSLSDVLVGVPRSASEKVFWGGPVQEDRFLLLQRSPDESTLADITQGIQFGSEEDFMRDLMDDSHSTIQQYRVFAGYAGWGEEQLQVEMDQCSWLIAPTSAADLVFDTAADEMWSAAIRSLGPEYAHLASMPLDPRVN
jgi:putative transcriptional regulator